MVNASRAYLSAEDKVAAVQAYAYLLNCMKGKKNMLDSDENNKIHTCASPC